MEVRRIGGWCEMAASQIQWSRVTWLVSESARGLLRFSPCELLLLEAGS
jgi:hypothetical protein